MAEMTRYLTVGTGPIVRFSENTLVLHFYKGKLSVLPIRLDGISSNGRTKSANCRIKNLPTVASKIGQLANLMQKK